MYLIGFERLPCERIMPPSCWLCGVWAVQIDQFVLAANLLRRQCVELTKKKLVANLLEKFPKTALIWRNVQRIGVEKF